MTTTTTTIINTRKFFFKFIHTDSGSESIPRCGKMVNTNPGLNVYVLLESVFPTMVHVGFNYRFIYRLLYAYRNNYRGFFNSCIQVLVL